MFATTSVAHPLLSSVTVIVYGPAPKPGIGAELVPLSGMSKLGVNPTGPGVEGVFDTIFVTWKSTGARTRSCLLSGRALSTTEPLPELSGSHDVLGRMLFVATIGSKTT